LLVFDLDELCRGQTPHRLRATPNQDTKTNDGSPIAGGVSLQVQDALFLTMQRSVVRLTVVFAVFALAS